MKDCHHASRYDCSCNSNNCAKSVNLALILLGPVVEPDAVGVFHGSDPVKADKDNDAGSGAEKGRGFFFTRPAAFVVKLRAASISCPHQVQLSLDAVGVFPIVLVWRVFAQWPVGVLGHGATNIRTMAKVNVFSQKTFLLQKDTTPSIRP